MKKLVFLFVFGVLWPTLVGSQELGSMVDTKVIPQIAAGEDWKTFIKVLNQSSEPNTISLEFKDKFGQPLSVASGNKDRLDFVLEAHKATEIILTGGRDCRQVGLGLFLPIWFM